jgi:hypothetical protein
MEEGKRQKTPKKPSSSFTTGAIALVFLIIGFEVALFVHKAAVTRLIADRDRPDTVYIVERPKPRTDASVDEDEEMETLLVRKPSEHSPEAVRVREKAARRPVETFRFNPNTATLEDLMRLGFSEKQAQSILNYRAKGAASAGLPISPNPMWSPIRYSTASRPTSTFPASTSTGPTAPPSRRCPASALLRVQDGLLPDLPPRLFHAGAAHGHLPFRPGEIRRPEGSHLLLETGALLPSGRSPRPTWPVIPTSRRTKRTPSSCTARTSHGKHGHWRG